jgi:hypothetical protein
MVHEVCRVDGLRKQAVSSVDQEDDHQGREQQRAQLADGSDLYQLLALLYE